MSTAIYFVEFHKLDDPEAVLATDDKDAVVKATRIVRARTSPGISLIPVAIVREHEFAPGDRMAKIATGETVVTTPSDRYILAPVPQ